MKALEVALIGALTVVMNLFVGVAFALLIAYPVSLLFNAVSPAFGGPELGYFQTVAALAILAIVKA